MKTYLCPSCLEKELERSLESPIELEGGTTHFLEELEELRLLLKNLLNPELLDQLLILYKTLDTEPKHCEMYSWFSRNSSVGSSCKYAQGALRKFKIDRLEKVREMLETCLDSLNRESE